MQFTKIIFPDSVIFFEKKWVENWLWGRSVESLLSGGEIIHAGKHSRGESCLATGTVTGAGLIGRDGDSTGRAATDECLTRRLRAPL